MSTTIKMGLKQEIEEDTTDNQIVLNIDLKITLQEWYGQRCYTVLTNEIGWCLNS